MLRAIKDNLWSDRILNDVRNIELSYFGSTSMDPMGLFLFWLPYQIRCKYFHAEKAIPMMCFLDETPIPAVRFINSLLEEFLDEELVKWFEDKNEKRIR